MKKILFALSMLAFAVAALPQARGADISMDFIYDNLSGGNWINVEGTDTAGNLMSPPAIRIGVLTRTVTGRTPITVGRGSATRISVGLLITTGAGPISRTTVGFGFRETTWIGDRPGSHGGLVAITSAGRLCLHAGRALFMKDNPSAGMWM